MQQRLFDWSGKLALLAGSVLATLLVFEFVVFRYILVPDDLLQNVTINDVVRYKPGSRAVFRYPDGHNALVTINANGWNASKASYPVARSPGRLRIAVVGDSYVHARFVDTSDSFADVLEQRLKASGLDAEVFRFGMDGAPLSQYLQMLRREVVRFRPDVVLVQLIHNDFDESYRMLHTRTGSSFLKLTKGADGRISEIAPQPFRPGFADSMRRFSTFRYLYYQTGLYLTLKPLISHYFWGGDDEWNPAFVSSGVDIRKVNDHPSNAVFARYVIDQMQQLARREGFKLAFAMDGVREAVYEARDPMAFEVGRLNRIAAKVTTSLGLPFLDLQDSFARDYALHRSHFEFPYDWHWNRRGNRVVGEALANFLLTDPGVALAASRTGVRPQTPRAPASGDTSKPLRRAVERAAFRDLGSSQTGL